MSNVVFRSKYKNEMEMFLKFQSERTKSATWQQKRIVLRHFDNFISRQKDNDLTEDNLHEWICSLKEKFPNTRNRYISVVRQFLMFFSSVSNMQVYIPSLPHIDDIFVPYFFSDKEKEAIFRIADDYPSSSQNTMPYIKVELPMVLRLLESTGARPSETLLLQMKDIDLERGVLIMKQTKRMKERYIPLSNGMTKILSVYCRKLGIVDIPNAYVFPRRDFTEHMNRYDLRNKFLCILRQAGLSMKKQPFTGRGACIYSLRHGFVVSALKRLYSSAMQIDDALPYLSVYLGHDNFCETEKYVKFSADVFPDEMEKFHSQIVRAVPDETPWETV